MAETNTGGSSTTNGAGTNASIAATGAAVAAAITQTANQAQNQSADQRLQGISRSLLIGVGGTGQKILLDVRQRLLQKYGGLEKLPIVSFLLLDTDQAIFTKNPNYSDAANLDNADKVHCTVHGVENLRKTLREYPHLREWLDPRTLSGDIHQGAGAVRARGRLAFFWNYDTISKRLQEEYTEITKDASKAIAIKNGLQVSEGVTVYIVGSLLGGTGSGMFLDLAYTVKQLFKTQRMLEIIGIFSIPPNTSAVAVDNRPNAYASLLELNHYTDNSTTFTAQYKPDQPAVENADPPFRYTYLVDTSSPTSNLGSVDKLVEMVGHSIFLDLTSEFQRQKRSNRDNFDQFLTVQDDLGCPQNYMSMGLSAIHFPKEKVLTACASRLAQHLLHRWTEPLQKVGNIGSFTEAELSKIGLHPDEVQRLLQVASAEEGTSVRDNALAFWNGVNQRYGQSYPGHGNVAGYLIGAQQEHLLKLVDTDPNPDILGKQRANLGEYLWQVQQNLKGLLPTKERALRGFLSECVNDPNRRHGVARAFLDQLSERFRNYVDNLSKLREEGNASLAPLAELRDAQLADIQRYAGDAALTLIPGAKRREIDEKKEAYLGHARRWDTTLIDIRTLDAAVYFYEKMQGIIESLKNEMDAYIERMKALEAHFKKEEQNAIETPADVNGTVLFDRGRRVEGDGGVVTYVEGDIDKRYAAYVGNGLDPANPAVSTAGAGALEELGTAGNIYGLREADFNRIKNILMGRCRGVFGAVETEAVLEKFFEKFGNGTDRAIEELRRIHALSQPFIHLQENAPAYKHHQNKEQTIVGVLHGAEPRSDAENAFKQMLKDTVQGIRDGQISNSNEGHQVLLLRERAAFPLRLLEGMESYRYAYDQARAQGSSANPIHTRKDVNEWVRIHPPSYEDQKQAWMTFCVAWAIGVIVEEKDVRYTALGQKETVKFIAHYRDRFGMTKSDPIGTFISITGDIAKLMQDAETEQESANKPPREAQEMVLLLCDQPTLRQQVEQGIEAKLVEWGVQEMGQRLLKHVNEQANRFPRPILRPYQQAITDYLERINYNPDAGVPVLPTPSVPIVSVANTPVASDTTVATVAAPSNIKNVRERLVDLKGLLEDGLITEADFEKQKTAILSGV